MRYFVSEPQKYPNLTGHLIIHTDLMQLAREITGGVLNFAFESLYECMIAYQKNVIIVW